MMCIRVHVCVRPCELPKKKEMELVDVFFFLYLSADWKKKNLQFKSIEFFHFATHIYVHSTYRSS